MPRPGTPGDPTSVGLGPRQTGLIKFDPPELIPAEEDPYAGYRNMAGFPTDLILAKKKEKTLEEECGGLEMKQLDEILDAIRAPIEWEENGQRWRLRVSREPATRDDILHLKKQLEFHVKSRQARPDGICPVRRELYSQCFDELIRQVAISSPERGLLLLRVREEAHMTFRLLHALQEVSIAFGVQEADQLTALRKEPEEMLEELRRERDELAAQAAKLLRDKTHLDESFAHRRQVDEKTHFDRMQLVKRSQQTLKRHLDHVMNAKKQKEAAEAESSSGEDSDGGGGDGGHRI